MSSVSNQDILPSAFLVHNASELASTIIPRRFWLASETLDATKRRVLKSRNQTQKESAKYVVLGWKLHTG